jgi:hypothetical protein
MTREVIETNPTRVVGKTVCTTPDGKTITTNAYEISKSGTLIQVSPNVPKEGSTEPLQEATTKLYFIRNNQIASAWGLPGGDRLNPSQFVNVLDPNTQTTFPVAEKNTELYSACYENALADITAAEDQVQRNKDINTCIEENLAALKSGASTIFSDIFTQVLNEGIELVLNEVNESLPDYAQVGLQLNPAGDGISSISVGGVDYNAADQSVTVGSETYTTLVNAGLDSINSSLPSELQISSSTLGLSLGDTTVTFDSLTTVDPNDPTKVVPAPPQNLGSGINVNVDPSGTINTTFGTEVFDVGKLVTNTTGLVFNAGLTAANVSLPDYLQIESDSQVTFENGQFNYETNKIAIGPVGYDAATGDLAVDTVDLTNQLSSYVEDLAGLDQLSAPFSSLAQVAWQALDPLSLIEGLLDGLLNPDEVAKEQELTYNRIKSACEGKYKPGTPGVVFPPVNNSSTSIDGQLVDAPPIATPPASSDIA